MADRERRRPEERQLRRGDVSDHERHAEIGRRRRGSDRRAVHHSHKGAGAGEVAARYAAELARTEPIISYVATRAFAEKHPDVVKAFRASIEEAAPIVNSDRDKATASIAKFTKMPIDLVRLTRPNVSKPDLKGSDFAWWVETMKQQDMLQGTVDLNKLVLP